MQNMLVKWSRYAAILGNFVFMVWVIYNGIDEGFQGTFYQILSYIGLILLLTLNSILLLVEGMRAQGQR